MRGIALSILAIGSMYAGMKTGRIVDSLATFVLTISALGCIIAGV